MVHSRRLPGRRTALVLGAALLVVLAVGLVVSQQRAAERSLDAAANTAATAFARAAQSGDLTAVTSASVQAQYVALVKGLGKVEPVVAVTAVRRVGTAGTADLRWTWPFGPDGWTYSTVLSLSAGGRSDDRSGDGAPWAGRFLPSVLHPQLVAGDLLEARRTRPARADVLGRDGSPLVTSTAVVEIGVQPSRAGDPAAVASTLAALLKVDAVALERRIKAARPDDFVAVVTLRRTEYLPLQARLKALPGTIFRARQLPLAPTRVFARGLLGAAGPVTAELVEQSKGRLAAGDIAGLSGLQRAYDSRLGGTAGVRVDQVRAKERTELFAVAPVVGRSLRVTLEADVQEAADAALAGATGGNGNASLVAIDVETGDVLAVAGTPVGAANRALTGRYPPGSTFKTVATLALLGAGLTPSQSVACPPTATVDGRSFRNFEGGSLGQVPFGTAFAQSCNTAFVGQSERLEPGSLQQAGTTVGLGVEWQVGTEVFAGDVPVTTTPVDLAAATIGQARVLVSPAAMAQVAATLARGTWQPPRLVLDPPPAGAVTAPPALNPAQAATVRTLMRQVVLSGTARALADVPGAPVQAKTGTAEYGTADPPRTHAWTIGFQRGIAFAVLVEDGTSGGAVAVPVAEAFLRGL